MATYEYKMLIGRDAAGGAGGVAWYLDGNGQPFGAELPPILNRLGAGGWRVAGLGDLGYEVRTEIILTREGR